MQNEEFSREHRSSRPFRRRRRGQRFGFAEHDQPRELPKPKGELPEAFAENAFGLLNPLLQHAVAEEGYLAPTPIQAQSIPPLLEGRDLLGCAQTGTGKTAAFLLPILHHLAADAQAPEPNHPRALVLAPTRELAAQIAACAAAYGKFIGIPFAVVFGGVGQFPQVKALNKGAEIVIATPGRLFDLMEQGHVTLENVKEFVLDEADRMLDMGFLPDIKRILEQLPAERHTQFFSATLSKPILALAHTMVKDPVEITISPDQPTVDRINQKLMFVDKANKADLLLALLHEHPDYEKVLVFARTRHGADKIVRTLKNGDVSADAIHSDKTQRMRINALNGFKNGRTRVLVATDIASRGIDVDNITHVINYDLPEETESYVHRIGRTARAGASGAAISFVSAEESGLLRAIERMIKKEIDICRDQAFHSEKAERAAGKAKDENGDPIPAWRKKKERPERRSSQRQSRLGRNQDDFRKPREEGMGSEERPPRRERPERSPRRERDESSERRYDRSARLERPERGRRYERRDNEERTDRAERPYRPRRDDRPARRPRFGEEERGERRSYSRPRREEERGERPRRREEKPFREKKGAEKRQDPGHWYDLPVKRKHAKRDADVFADFDANMRKYDEESEDCAPKRKGGKPPRSGSFDRFKKRR